MRLTTKGRFAVTAMVDLAINGGKGPVTLFSISERQKISLSYLEQLFGKLRRNNLVESVRGPGGGYYLARIASKINIAEIVVAVDEPMDATNCAEKGNCHDGKPCLTHELWMGLNEKIYEYLSHISLQQLVEGKAQHHTGATAIKMNSKVGG
ncbi:MAG: DNA-binding protein [Gallionellales bacterium CG_4_10_14_3_um_filter_54_96]|nr:MAG: DNA-binding protein [Gallionellales bacterium CG17_big_fil_post_rev_8_21_14_2_50_54_146]PIY06843.1 MAG: DNA-binding protein [Gallionellales bacterium CG_4_10_14_3_um_filter_54_96]PJC03507.1 MAG: DNA-binding protein [Gallionellales bacterium CG_4_9_14_0_8_um_filter_55_61]